MIKQGESVEGGVDADVESRPRRVGWQSIAAASDLALLFCRWPLLQFQQSAGTPPAACSSESLRCWTKRIRYRGRYSLEHETESALRFTSN